MIGNGRVVAKRGDVVLRLARDEDLPRFGFITFYLFPQQGYGHIDNNGVHPDYVGKGWGKYMYQHVLQHFITGFPRKGPYTDRAALPLITRTIWWCNFEQVGRTLRFQPTRFARSARRQLCRQAYPQ